jgi:hypothetical protein
VEASQLPVTVAQVSSGTWTLPLTNICLQVITGDQPVPYYYYYYRLRGLRRSTARAKRLGNGKENVKDYST